MGCDVFGTHCQGFRERVCTASHTLIRQVYMQSRQLQSTIPRHTHTALPTVYTAGTSEPGSTKSIKAHTSPAPSPPRINISISSEGRRSISQAAPEALRSPGPLHFR